MYTITLDDSEIATLRDALAYRQSAIEDDMQAHAPGEIAAALAYNSSIAEKLAAITK